MLKIQLFLKKKNPKMWGVGAKICFQSEGAPSHTTPTPLNI